MAPAYGLRRGVIYAFDRRSMKQDLGRTGNESGGHRMALFFAGAIDV